MTDKEEIIAVMEGLAQAWNAGDPAAWVENYQENCILITTTGAVLQGREENYKRHESVFSGIFKGSSLDLVIDRLHFIADGSAAVVDTTMSLTGYKGLPPGIPATKPGTLVMLMRHILGFDGLKWSIGFSQNQAVPPISTGAKEVSSS